MNAWEKRRAARALQDKGIWVPVSIDGKEWKFHVRGRESAVYQEVLGRVMRPLRARYKDNIPSDKITAALYRALAEGALIGWEGVTDERGEPLPFTVDNAISVLDVFPEVRDTVTGQSLEYGTFLAEAEAEAAKN